MRMWNVNPKLMCYQHIRGEHVEMHMFVGAINKGKSISGYIRNKLVDVAKLLPRHDVLAEEMVKRGMCHVSPLPDFVYNGTYTGDVDSVYNLAELYFRCEECRKLQEKQLKKDNL